MDMLDQMRARYYAFRQRARRFERREIRELRRWVEHTSNLIHLSVLLFVPFLVGVVTWLSGTVQQLSFLLFPPLASGTYMLFSDPQGEYSSPWKFIGGLTVGALCGWAALEFSAAFIYHVPPNEFQVAPAGAALGVFFTAIATWMFNVEEPSAFSTALLVLITTTARLDYVITVIISSGIVAAVFVGWRELFYNQRAEYLYQSVKGDDHVLVPIRGEKAETTAMFAAHLAAAHRAGKVVLLDTVGEEIIEDAEQNMRSKRDAETRVPVTDGNGGIDISSIAEQEVTEQRLERLARIERQIEDEIGVTCETTITVNRTSAANAVLRAAKQADCDLIVTPYEEDQEGLSSYIRQLFGSDVDAVAFRSVRDQVQWKRILVPIQRAGDIAHSMLDFAQRLGGDEGWVSVCSCISSGSERRTAERMLANIVETVGCACEIHVAHAKIEEYLAERAPNYDLVIIGASTDRNAASRLLSPPTFERIHGIDCDVAVVHEG